METLYYIVNNNFIIIRGNSDNILRAFNNDKKLREIFKVPPNEKFRYVWDIKYQLCSTSACSTWSYASFWYKYRSSEPFFGRIKIDLEFSLFDTLQKFVGIKTKLLRYNAICSFNFFLLGVSTDQIKLQKSLFDRNLLKLIKDFL